jgi:hypothetical protein
MEGVTQSLIHHLAAIIGIIAQFHLHTFNKWLIAYFVLTGLNLKKIDISSEASTPFVNLRWRLHVLDMHHGKEFIFVSLLMSISFFVVRTIPLPFVIYQGIIIEGILKFAIHPLGSIVQLLGLGALCSLNAFWSYKIAAGWFGVILKKFRHRNE